MTRRYAVHPFGMVALPESPGTIGLRRPEPWTYWASGRRPVSPSRRARRNSPRRGAPGQAARGRVPRVATATVPEPGRQPRGSARRPDTAVVRPRRWTPARDGVCRPWSSADRRRTRSRAAGCAVRSRGRGCRAAGATRRRLRGSWSDPDPDGEPDPVAEHVHPGDEDDDVLVRRQHRIEGHACGDLVVRRLLVAPGVVVLVHAAQHPPKSRLLAEPRGPALRP